MKNLSFKLITIVILIGSFVSCGEHDSQKEKAEPNSDNPTSADSSYVVGVIALDYAFAMPEEIPSGWVSFRMRNRGAEVHKAFIAPAPDTMNFKEAQKRVREAIELGKDRDWHFSSLSPGPFFETGMVSPELTTQTSVHLDPGIYFMLCDV